MGAALAILFAAAQAAAAVHAPPLARGLPPGAADHVVVMAVRESPCLTCGNHRRTVTRSGAWLRDDRVYADRSETRWSDFASGTSFRIARDRRGIVQSLSVERTVRDNDWSALRREATGRRDGALGEGCEIWAVTGDSHRSESCETADGIALWTRSIPPRAAAAGSARAVSLERRPIRPEEVRPPAGFFALAPWPRHDAASAAGAGGYEVVLAASGRDDGKVRILRRQGDLVATRSEGGDVGSTWASDGASRFSYLLDRNGRAFRLEVERFEGRYVARWERVTGRSPERVLGESCIWRNDANTPASDVRHECQAADGVPLMRETQWHWPGGAEAERARSVSRRPLTEADMAPPAEALDWTNWGVAPPRP